MKKTITMYELLGLIKDGKAPYKFVFNDNEYRWDYQDKKYYRKADIDELDQQYYELFEDDYNLYFCLNDEVEILDEEEFEDIEEIELANDEKIKGYYNGGIHYMTTNVKDREVYIKLINQLIKNQKKIIQKLNK